MGCNCGKKKKGATKPTGLNADRRTQSDPRETDPRTSTALNGNSGKTQRFTLQKPDGTRETYGSKLEAMAEQARNGGVLRF